MPLNLTPYHIRLEGHKDQDAFNKHIANQINTALDKIQKTAFGSQVQVVGSSVVAAASGGGTPSTSGKVIPLSQSLNAGVWNTITFNRASSILSFPRVFGMVRNETLEIEFQYDLTGMPNSFKINPSAATNIMMYMSYQNL